MEKRASVIVVTGASSGIGNACATYFAKKGHRVYGTCRNPAAYVRKADEFFELLPMELRDTESVSRAAESVLGAEGRVDVLVCCAGSGLVGGIEDSSLEEAQSVMDINFFGTLRTIKAFLPAMRDQRKGRIVVVGGMEAVAATPYQGLYSASESALGALVESLRLEVAGFGIEACFVALGSFRTAYGQKRRLTAGFSMASPYRSSFESASGILSRDEANGADPLIAARAVSAAISARRMPPRKTAGSLRRRAWIRLKAWLPASLFERWHGKYFRLEMKGAQHVH